MITTDNDCPAMPSTLFTVHEVAEILKISVPTVRRAVKAGSLDAFHVGPRRQVRVSEEAIEAYLQAGPKNGTSRKTKARAPRARAGKLVDGPSWKLIRGDARDGLGLLANGSVNCVVTSPPYYWQRDYEIGGQIGHESSIEGYVDTLVDVFSEVKRVLSDDGVVFLNLGDTYYNAKGKPHGRDPKHSGRQMARRKLRAVDGPGLGLPRKSLIGIPWRTALALQQDGWTLRSDIIWRRPGSMPEPTAKDRPWRTHEHVFVLSKTARYYFNREGLDKEEDVWSLIARPENPGGHFAPYPLELASRCVACGAPEGGVVLDPFVGSGTTMIAALESGRSAIGIDLKNEYVRFAEKRIAEEFTPLLSRAQPD